MDVEFFDEDLISGMDRIHEAAQGLSGTIDLVPHTAARVHDEPQADRLTLASVEIGDVLGDAVFVHDEVLALESRDIGAILVSDRDRDRLGRTHGLRLGSGRDHCLLAGQVRRTLLGLGRDLQHLLA